MHTNIHLVHTGSLSTSVHIDKNTHTNTVKPYNRDTVNCPVDGGVLISEASNANMSV